MKLNVYSTSGPSFQPVKNGKPFNKWVGTIKFSQKDMHGVNSFFYGSVTADTKEQAEEKLSRYKYGDTVNISESKLAMHHHKRKVYA